MAENVDTFTSGEAARDYVTVSNIDWRALLGRQKVLHSSCFLNSIFHFYLYKAMQKHLL